MDTHDKPNSRHEEDAYVDLPKHHEDAVIDYVPDTEEERRLVRKIDMYLLPAIWGMYLLSYMDRTKSVAMFPGSQREDPRGVVVC